MTMKSKRLASKRARKSFIRMAHWNIRFFELPNQPQPGYKYVHFDQGLMMILPTEENANEAHKNLDNSQHSC